MEKKKYVAQNGNGKILTIWFQNTLNGP